MLTWILFAFGLICLFAGIFILASNIDIRIKYIRLSNDILGEGLITTGAILAFLMLFAKGVAWMCFTGSM